MNRGLNIAVEFRPVPADGVALNGAAHPCARGGSRLAEYSAGTARQPERRLPAGFQHGAERDAALQAI